MGLIRKNATTGGPVTPKGPAELNQLNNNNSNIIMQTSDHEQQTVRGAITGEGQELSVEDESRLNGDEYHEILNDHIQMELVGLTNNSTTEKQQQQKTQTQASSLVRWERFLPVRSLKVLLVENDESTRHVVCALLRNCGYEVVPVANGLQAWKVLEDLTTAIGLVLTEVVLPCLTGISLLSKIMSHKSCKNIPVIMMSSHDSMSIVFKCLSKGAVDFLGKPIRKNELKNLWQHVWRKCHSSSGSGSESGIRTQKSLKSESAEHSDNKQYENYDGDDIGSIGLNARDRSDNGSGTQQSSWTKIAVEVDSPRQMSPWNQFVDPPRSTCVQVTHSIPNAIDNNGVPKTNGCERQDDVFDMELETGIPSIPLLQPQGQWEEAPSNLQGCNKQKMSKKKNADEEKQKRQVELTIQRTTGEYQNQVTEPTCVDTNNSIDPLLAIQVVDNQNGKVSTVKDKKSYADKEMPSFEFSSKSLNGVRDLGSSTQDHNILRQSERSAFSRYNSTSHQAPTGNVGSCSPIDNSSAATKTESLQCLQSYLNAMLPNQHSNGSNNNNDMGSSANNAFTKPSTTIDEPTKKPTVKYVYPSLAFQLVQNASPQPIPQDLVENGEKQQIQVQHHHHDYHHHHHHHKHNMVAKQLINHNVQSLEKETTNSRHDAPSNLSSTLIKNDPSNQSLKGSASGSNHGSNVQIGSNAISLERVSNMENDMTLVEKDGTTSGIRFDPTNATIHDRFAQREAALNKFRQKRKERCFDKKVRYQSRKKLAEQRPRVRGQFVKQIVDNNKGNASHQ